MMFRKRSSTILILSLAVMTISVAGLVVARAANVRDTVLLFQDVMHKIRDEYVDQVDLEKLIYGGIRGMLDTLDPHSQFLTKKQYDDLMVSTHGSFGGLGIEIDIRNDWLTVIAPIEGTPAHQVGLIGGDRIVKIEGKSTRGITMTDAIQKLRGPKGSDVTITIQREGEPELLDYTITRDIIKIKSVPFAGMIDDEIGYVRLAAFSDETSDELRDALKDLRSEGMQKMILDLRRNTGGLLSQAIAVSEQFLEEDQVVVSTRGRQPQQNRQFKAGSRARGGDYPLVVLVDNQSASASEIVAGAVQDLDRGLVVGLTTFGKGTVQSVMRLPGGNALKLTTAKYYTPSGRCINKYEEIDDDDAFILPEGAADSTRAFYTAAGRTVYGGGGIRPDVKIEPEELAKIVSRLARQGLVFEFAVTYVAHNGEVPGDFGSDPVLMESFRDFLAEKEFEYTDEEFEEGEDFISIMLRSEIARKVWGDDASYRIRLEGDSQLLKTIDLVREATTLSELFASAEQFSGTEVE
jgi:carboxyl-terminal processing protease